MRKESKVFKKVEQFFLRAGGIQKLGFGNFGYSLIEMLVVVFIFTIVALIISQSIGTSLKNSRKSEDVSIVKENIEYALSTMERLLRNAKRIDCITPNKTRLEYIDENDKKASFVCMENSYIASVSASASVRLTSPEVDITNTNCEIFSYDCDGKDISISVTAKRTGKEGAEAQTVTYKTRILLRSY